MPGDREPDALTINPANSSSRSFHYAGSVAY